MPNGVYNTADGQLNVTMVRPNDWQPFCEAIERPTCCTTRVSPPTPRAAQIWTNSTQCVRPVFAAKPTAWLAERLTARGIMNGQVNS